MRALILRLLLPFLVLLTLLTVYSKSNRRYETEPHPDIDQAHLPHDPNTQQWCPFALSSFDFKDDLFAKSYSRIVIQPTFVEQKVPSLVELDGSYLINYGVIDSPLQRQHPEPQDDCASSPIVSVEVTHDPPRSYTEGLLIGITTPLNRLDKRLNEISYYLLSSKASLLVAVPGNDGVDLEEAQKRYRSRGLDITLVRLDVEPFQLRYFTMWKVLAQHIASSRPDTQWIATADDDSFYPQLLHLCARLQSLDPAKYHWIGTLSESSLNVKNFGYFSYGGSGIFMSRSLLDRIASDFDACTGDDIGPPSFGGDHRTSKCIYKLVPSLNITVWNELRQWDLRGHPAGLFESGRPIWSYHHWGQTGWFDKDVLSMCATATVAGQASILQRWKFTHVNNARAGSALATAGNRTYHVLTNGYSIVRYDLEAGVPDIDFDKTEYTWADNPVDYEDFVGPFRTVNATGVRKKRWDLYSVKMIGENVHQMYRYKKEYDFMEVVWLNGHRKGTPQEPYA